MEVSNATAGLPQVDVGQAAAVKMFKTALETEKNTVQQLVNSVAPVASDPNSPLGQKIDLMA